MNVRAWTVMSNCLFHSNFGLLLNFLDSPDSTTNSIGSITDASNG